MKKYDFIIVGSGILGLSHAYHALKKGKSVLILEKDNQPAGASIQNFGQIVPSGFGVDWQKYGLESLRIYEEIQSIFDIGIKKEGTIYLASDSDEELLLDELHLINSKQKYSSRRIDVEECKSKFPFLKDNYCKSGLYFENELKAEPRLTVPRLITYLAGKFNLEIRFNTYVTDIYSSENEAIAFDSLGNKFFGDNLLLCSGDNVKTLVPWIFEEVDFQIVKLQMMETIPQKVIIPGSVLSGLSIRRYESFQECPSFQTIKNKEIKDDYLNRFGIHILFKQNLDGSVIIGDSHEYSDIASVSNLCLNVLDSEINEIILEAAGAIFDLNFKIRRSWVGCYSQLKDQDILNKRIDKRIRLITGIGGKGMTASLGWSFYNFEELN